MPSSSKSHADGSDEFLSVTNCDSLSVTLYPARHTLILPDERAGTLADRIRFRPHVMEHRVTEHRDEPIAQGGLVIGDGIKNSDLESRIASALIKENDA